MSAGRMVPEADLVALARASIQNGSKSFAAAARLFDPQTRAGAYLLYTWCRHCDDVIDGQELGHRTPSAQAAHNPARELERLYQMTADAMAGKAMADPVFAAFQRVIAHHGIPHRHPMELIDGFAMDVRGRTYDTIGDTLEYCYHVAGVVGVMMAYIMGARAEDTLDRASDLGLAFQLTNIARDLVDDAAAGRIYVPADWIAEAGLTRETLAAPQHRSRLFRIVERLLATADVYYTSSEAGLARLPRRSRWAVETARTVYREIGREVLRRGPAAWDTRVSTTTSQKVQWALASSRTTLAATRRDADADGPSRVGLWTRPKD